MKFVELSNTIILIYKISKSNHFYVSNNYFSCTIIALKIMKVRSVEIKLVNMLSNLMRSSEIGTGTQ